MGKSPRTRVGKAAYVEGFFDLCKEHSKLTSEHGALYPADPREAARIIMSNVVTYWFGWISHLLEKHNRELVRNLPEAEIDKIYPTALALQESDESFSVEISHLKWSQRRIAKQKRQKNHTAFQAELNRPTMLPGARNATKSTINTDPPVVVETGPRLEYVHDDLAFLEANREPGLWHSIVSSVSHEELHSLELMLWVISQPDCPNAVAAKVFERIGGASVIGRWHLGELATHETRILHTILQREEGYFFPADSLSDAPGFDRAGLLSRCLEIERRYVEFNDKQPQIATPRKLLATVPTGPLPTSEYFADEAGIARIVNG